MNAPENKKPQLTAEGDDPNDDEDVDEDQVVFILEGQQRCYGSKRAWEAAY